MGVADAAEGRAGDAQEWSRTGDPIDEVGVVLEGAGVDPGGVGKALREPGGIGVAVDPTGREPGGEVAVGEEVDGDRIESRAACRRGRGAGTGAEDEQGMGRHASPSVSSRTPLTLTLTQRGGNRRPCRRNLDPLPVWVRDGSEVSGAINPGLGLKRTIAPQTTEATPSPRAGCRLGIENRTALNGLSQPSRSSSPSAPSRRPSRRPCR